MGILLVLVFRRKIPIQWSMIGILFFTSVIGIYVLQSGQRVKNLKLPQQLQVLCVLLVRLLCLL
jgi:hypothetical protein